ncbi:MAG TPA: hypothetical protein PKN30_03550 [Flavobacteriales bacterium]|nr:hypothetical protein [Flavobacteriales bacterium]
MRNVLLHIVAITLVFIGCRKETPNPYDELERTTPNPTVESIPEGNFAWIHQRILRPNCALSGCHDGTFEPEFRSIGSSYNSLVLHPVVANDPQQSFTYRVVPGNVNASFLHARLNTFIPNTSGVMPLGFSENSTWPANSAAFKAAIDQWIASGAPDMFGQLPGAGGLQPQVSGILALPAGVTHGAYPRGIGEGIPPIEVPASEVDLWFAFSDDRTPVGAFSHNKAKLTTAGGSFESVPELELHTDATLTGPDFGNTTTRFSHRVRIDLSGFAPGSILCVRVYVQDEDHDTPVEIPGNGVQGTMANYFSLRIAS